MAVVRTSLVLSLLPFRFESARAYVKNLEMQAPAAMSMNRPNQRNSHASQEEMDGNRSVRVDDKYEDSIDPSGRHKQKIKIRLTLQVEDIIGDCFSRPVL